MYVRMTTVKLSHPLAEPPDLKHDELSCKADLTAELAARKLKYAEGFNPNSPRCIGDR